MFPIACAKFARDFSTGIFLIVPNLHHNAWGEPLSWHSFFGHNPCKVQSTHQTVSTQGFASAWGLIGKLSCASTLDLQGHRLKVPLHATHFDCEDVHTLKRLVCFASASVNTGTS
jgi:hypothetical protein